MICKRCGNKIMYTKEEEYPGLTAIRCFHCDKWIKWADENEKRVIPSREGVVAEMKANELQIIKTKYKKIEEIINSPDYDEWEALDKIAEVIKG